MGDLVKITLTGPAKIDGEIRAMGWSGEVGSDIAQQLAEAGAATLEAGDEPVLVEAGADPRDDVIARLQDDIGELRFEADLAKAKHAAALDLLGTRLTEATVAHDQALARVADLEARIVETEGERDEARERIAELEDQAASPPDPAPAPAVPTKKTRAASSS